MGQTYDLDDSNQLIRPARAEKLLDVSRRTLRRYEISGKLPPVKLNSRVTRYRLSDVLKLIVMG